MSHHPLDLEGPPQCRNPFTGLGSLLALSWLLSNLPSLFPQGYKQARSQKGPILNCKDASRLTAALKESTQPLMVMECGHFLGGK